MGHSRIAQPTGTESSASIQSEDSCSISEDLNDNSLRTSPSSAVDILQKHSLASGFLHKFLGEVIALIAYAIFVVCLYLTAAAVFRIKLLSKPFEGPKPIGNATEAERMSDRQMYIASSFSLIVMLIIATAIGYFISLIKLPALLGMLVAGIALRNACVVDLFLLKEWGMTLRKIAFVVILLRGGLGLDSSALKRLKGACFRLSFVPCTVEATAIAVVSHFVLSLPWMLAFVLGFVLAAVSPAVVVPPMLRLKQKGYGVASGVPTLLIAAATIDDVYAITGFEACLSASFTRGGIVWTIVRAPLEVAAGLLLGSSIGLLLWYIPNEYGRMHFTRVMLLLQISCASMFGSEALGFTSVGPIAVLVSALVAGLRWKAQHTHKENGGSAIEENALAMIWDFAMQPILFASIGFELDIRKMGSTVYRSVLVIFIGLVFRWIAAFCATFGAHLKLREQVFIAFAWTPKATVQAALSPIVLDMATSEAIMDESHMTAGLVILTTGVLSILITAPLGAILIHAFAPILLTKGEPESKPRAETISEIPLSLD